MEAKVAEYKPIVDKAKEFIDFFADVFAEIKKIENLKRRTLEASFNGLTTRNHLIYIKGRLLYTPLGKIDIPYHTCAGCSSIKGVRQLHERLVERFGLIEIRPELDDYPGMYYVPLDPKQPSLDLPELIVSGDLDVIFKPRMDAVFRRDCNELYDDYVTLRLGGWAHSIHLNLDDIFDEYHAWRCEVSLIDDSIPFENSVSEECLRALLSNHEHVETL
jgi:hypothetical protein